jgi:hypothetical protein
MRKPIAQFLSNLVAPFQGLGSERRHAYPGRRSTAPPCRSALGYPVAAPSGRRLTLALQSLQLLNFKLGNHPTPTLQTGNYRAWSPSYRLSRKLRWIS